MQKFLVLFLFSAFFLAGCSSEKDEPGISGRYVGTQNFGIGQVSSAMVIQIRQKGTLLTGTVTPPFQEDPVTIFNGNLDGTSFQFDSRHNGITFRYSGVIHDNQMQGGFGPLGCVEMSASEPCQTDSGGSFNTQKL